MRHNPSKQTHNNKHINFDIDQLRENATQLQRDPNEQNTKTHTNKKHIPQNQPRTTKYAWASTNRRKRKNCMEQQNMGRTCRNPTRNTENGPPPNEKAQKMPTPENNPGGEEMKIDWRAGNISRRTN